MSSAASRKTFSGGDAPSDQPSGIGRTCDAVRWYEQKRAGLGGEFFDAVTDAMELVRTRPEVGVVAGRTRSWLLARFPYRLFYRVRDEDVYVRRDRKPKTRLLEKPNHFVSMMLTMRTVAGICCGSRIDRSFKQRNTLKGPGSPGAAPASHLNLLLTA